MPYSFTEIERTRSWIVRFAFVILIVIYFAAAWLIGVVFKIFYFEKFHHPFLTPGESLAVLFFALLAGFIHWYVTVRNLTEKIIASLGAKDLDTKDGYHRIFQNILEEVSIATGGKKVRGVIIPTSALNAFAVSDYSDNNVIGITEGLLARLKRHQLEAVVGHEMAHIVSGDSLTSSIICSLFGLYREILDKIRKGLAGSSRIRTRTKGGGGFPVVIVIVYIILVIVVALSNFLKLFMSRQREYRADAVAIRLTRDPLGLAEALYVISSNWRGGTIRGDGLSPLFIISPKYRFLDESEGFFADLFTTHPPIQKRLSIALDIAHASPDELPLALKKREKAIMEEEKAPVILSAEKNAWHLYRDGKWEGPFPFAQIAGLAYLRPDTWVREEHAGKVKMAYQDDDLRPIFKKEGTSDLPCPRCRQGLSQALYERAPIYYCAYCDGKLLDSDKIVRIITREDRPFSKEVVRMAGLIRKEELKREPKLWKVDLKKIPALACPRCKRPMDRKFYSIAYHIEIERCLYCGLLWFDRYELEVLQYLIETSRDFKT